MSKTRIAVFASGNGSNFQALIDACQSGTIKGEIVTLISNSLYAGAVARAKKSGIEVLIYDPKEFKTRTVWCSKMAKELKERRVDLVCLAGFMLKLEPCMIRSFPHRILNIHPALLPKYGGKGMYGQHVHQAVIKAGEKESGCTIHLVDEIYDNGPILAQAKVSVSSDDTPESLAKKIHVEEHKLYVSVVANVCSGKLNLDEAAKKTVEAKEHI